jgi:protein-disulfide isomerase
MTIAVGRAAAVDPRSESTPPLAPAIHWRGLQPLGLALSCALLAACATATPAKTTNAGGAGGQQGETQVEVEGRLPRAFGSAAIAPYATSLGPKRAKLLIEWFSDFECPYCAKAHRIMLQLARRFPRRLRIRYRDYPLDMQCNPKITRPFHARACIAAFHARCAAEQGKFWPYAELLAKNYRALDNTTLKAHASALLLDRGRFMRCLNSKAPQQAIEADLDAAIKLGVRGTPSYYIDGKQVRQYTLQGWIRTVEKRLRKIGGRGQP